MRRVLAVLATVLGTAAYHSTPFGWGTAAANPQDRAGFDRLASTPNVVRALRGDEPEFVTNDPRQYWLSKGSISGHKTRPLFDAKVGGLRFDVVPVPQIPAGQPGDAANIAGAFYFNFGKHFGPNQKFRVRWQQMFNEAMVKTLLRNDTAIKQVIVGSGDGPGLRRQASCTAPEIVVTSYAQFRFSHLYHACGRYWGLYGSPRFAFQNQVPERGPFCNYDATDAQARAGDRLTPPGACIGWPVMQWQDYALEVENGAIVPERGQYRYSVVRLYIGLNPDGSLRLAHEWDSRKLPPSSEWKGLGLFVGDEATGERFYGKFWGTPYMTGYRGGHSDTMQTWYRHFIVTDETAMIKSSTASPVAEVAPAIAALPENSAIDLGPYRWTDTGGHADGAVISDYSGMVYAPSLRSMLVMGGGHTSTDYDAVNSFSTRTLSWRELYLPTPGARMTPQNYDRVRGAWLQGEKGPYPRPVARHTLDELVVANNEIIVLAQVDGNGKTAGNNWPEGYTSYNLATRARIAHLELRSLEWTFAPDDYGAENFSAAEYDPPSGKVVLLGAYGLYAYDPVEKRKSLSIDFQSYPGANQVRDEKGSRIPAGAVFELEANRADFSKSVVRLVADAPIVGAATKFAYDAKNQLIGGGLWGGVFHAFDPRTRSWSSKKIDGPKTIAFMAMDYDPDANAYIC
jgi:hypothetical protein